MTMMKPVKSLTDDCDLGRSKASLDIFSLTSIHMA